jgi:exosortase/archaeosortase family protein
MQNESFAENAGVIAATSLKTARKTREKLFSLTRAELFAAVLVGAVCNALLPTIVNGISVDGAVYGVLNTFEISVIVWVGTFIGIRYALQIPDGRIDRWDIAVICGALIGCLLPLGPFTWVLLSGLALYLILGAKQQLSPQAHAGWIMLAVTVPMFWSKRVFNLFSDFFLSADAMLVSSITQTERTSNLVAMPGGSGFLQIAAPCSSMANLSLAMLCWVLFTQTSGLRWRPRNFVWCLIACLAVVAINVTRITLIGFFPHSFDLLHGPIGSTVASWLTVFATVGICYHGVRRAPVAQV